MPNIKQYNFSYKMLLLVDDSSMNRVLVKAILKETSIDIVYATTGLEAVAKFRRYFNGIDFVLLDIGLPDIDGLEVLKRIRKINIDIPVIAHTASIDGKEHFINIGFTDFVPKPFKETELLNIMDKYLNNN